MKNFKGLHEKPKHRRENYLNRGRGPQIICLFKSGLAKEEGSGGVFEGRLIPQCTLQVGLYGSL